MKLGERKTTNVTYLYGSQHGRTIYDNSPRAWKIITSRRTWVIVGVVLVAIVTFWIGFQIGKQAGFKMYELEIAPYVQPCKTGRTGNTPGSNKSENVSPSLKRIEGTLGTTYFNCDPSP